MRKFADGPHESLRVEYEGVLISVAVTKQGVQTARLGRLREHVHVGRNDSTLEQAVAVALMVAAATRRRAQRCARARAVVVAVAVDRGDHGGTIGAAETQLTERLKQAVGLFRTQHVGVLKYRLKAKK